MDACCRQQHHVGIASQLGDLIVGDEAVQHHDTSPLDDLAVALQSELDLILAGLEEADPDRWGLGASVRPLHDQIAGPYRSAMILLGIAAGTVGVICRHLESMAYWIVPEFFANLLCHEQSIFVR